MMAARMKLEEQKKIQRMLLDKNYQADLRRSPI
jgi:hypothetical protein